MISTCTVTVTVAAVSAAFGLERSLRLFKVRSEPIEHSLNDVIRPNPEDLISNFSQQMPVPQMPGNTHELMWIPVPDLHNNLRSGLNLQQPAVVELQGISISHGHRFWKFEKDIFAVIRSEANAAAMACIEIKGNDAGRLLLRPVPCGAMNGTAEHHRINT